MTRKPLLAVKKQSLSSKPKRKGILLKVNVNDAIGVFEVKDKEVLAHLEILKELGIDAPMDDITQ